LQEQFLKKLQKKCGLKIPRGVNAVSLTAKKCGKTSKNGFFMLCFCDAFPIVA